MVAKSKKGRKRKIPVQFIINAALAIIVAYYTSTWTFNFQKVSGKYLILEIASFYAYNFVTNGIDIKRSVFKSSEEDRQLYLRSLLKVEEKLNSLSSNPYYIDLIKDYPDIILLKFRISNNIVSISRSSQLVTDGKCHLAIVSLYEQIKEDLPSKLFNENGQYYEVDQAIMALKQVVSTSINEMEAIDPP